MLGKSVLLVFGCVEVEDFARPEAVGADAPRRPQAFGREDSRTGFQAL